MAGLGLLWATVFLFVGHLRRKDLEPPRFVIVLMIVAIVGGLLLRFGLPAILSYSPCAQQADVGACVRENLRQFEWPEGRRILTGLRFADGNGILLNVRLVLTLLPFASGSLVWWTWLAVTAFRNYRVFDLIVLLGTLFSHFFHQF